MQISGKIVEMGRLESVDGDGITIKLSDGRFVSIVGLTPDEIRSLPIFADVVLTVNNKIGVENDN